MYRRNTEATERTRQRQEREDNAPRLADEIPELRTLRLSIQYRRGDVKIGESTHTRVVVVPRAPALFVVPCHDRDCRDGGHDITASVMHGLRSRREQFEGTDACHGSLGSAGSRCTAVLIYEASATYG